MCRVHFFFIRFPIYYYYVGLNGVDNGRIMFNHFQLTRTDLLSRFGGVNEHGIYMSSLKDKETRFGIQMVALSRGRVNLMIHSNTASKLGLSIAIRYALSRRQFKSKDLGSNEGETLLLDYITHQVRY